MQIIGIVCSGLGKGKEFVPKYNFAEKLGFTPFPGTLNIEVEKRPVFPEAKKITIHPEQGGQVDCYPTIINKIHKGFIIIPHKTTHPEKVLEIIAPVNLREYLQITDGDEITCELV